ncbi:MAG: phosphoribosyl-AMP cyclohydrolase [Pseudomonadales bacterium]|nr:phosphoribosyl-AMP cyclohydrolase [Pseudomonadales bacterium]
MSLLDEILWNEQGLVPAIAQDWQNGRVLMMAWMNAESLTLRLQECRAVYFSRSRQKLWRKGEDSGHVQKLHGIWIDCDGDALLLRVEQIGGIACHTGRVSCFYRHLNQGSWVSIDPILKTNEQIYGHSD